MTRAFLPLGRAVLGRAMVGGGLGGAPATDPPNPGFEAAGGRAGFSDPWILYTTSTGEGVAGYSGTSPIAAVTDGSNLTGVAWVPLGVEVLEDAGPCPSSDGDTTCDALYEHGGFSPHHIQHLPGVDLIAGRSYTVGVTLKAGTGNFAGIEIQNGDGIHDADRIYAIIDLTTGRLTYLSGPANSLFPIQAEIVTLPESWFRVSLVFQVFATAIAVVAGVTMSADGSNPSDYTGVPGHTVFVWSLFLYEGVLEDAERFERGWVTNELNTATIPSGVAALYTTAFVLPSTFESFETGWLNYPFNTNIVLGEQAVYGATMHSFEVESVIVDSPDFEFALPPGIMSGSRASLTSTSTLPAPFDSAVLYWVYEDDAESFALSLTEGGESITILDAGEGTITMHVGGVGPSGFPVDDFESGWLDNEDSTPTIEAKVAALYVGAHPFENFEAGWRANDTSTPTIESSEAASYDGAIPEAFEDFEEVLFDRSFEVDPTTDIFTSGGHSYVGTNVVYALNVGGAYPGGLFKTIPYWVLVIDADTLKLSKTHAGSAIDVTTDGEPEHFLRGDPSRYWNSADRNTTLG